ncbi:NUDIX domain-containing protein [Opitutales bacterium ASA1]|uniref:NUDIX hydrolase n=1 Tax=Congregicoccus parvus TaxID=3081749 RepID=UPI002B2D740E|nr:NUDIX domain-containing protein [Opitutales bacterium ASA1]
MNEEWFDVVDDQDRVIGRELRAEVHRRGLLHRAVHVLVFDRKGRVFLQKRSMRKDTWPGAWDSSASGHVDSGEAYDACAVRELREELGWTPSRAPERILRIEACAETGQEFVWVYRCAGEGPFVLHPEEIERGEWFTPAAIDAAITERPDTFALSFRHLWGIVRVAER